MGTIIACTLTPAEKPDRVARWRELFEHALNSRRVPGEAVITFDNADRVKSELDELIKLERICCACRVEIGRNPGAIVIDPDGGARRAAQRATGHHCRHFAKSRIGYGS